MSLRTFGVLLVTIHLGTAGALRKPPQPFVKAAKVVAGVPYAGFVEEGEELDCSDIVRGASRRNSAWRRPNELDCKCAKGLVLFGEDKACKPLWGQRYFGPHLPVHACSCDTEEKVKEWMTSTTTMSTTTVSTEWIGHACKDAVKNAIPRYPPWKQYSQPCACPHFHAIIGENEACTKHVGTYFSTEELNSTLGCRCQDDNVPWPPTTAATTPVDAGSTTIQLADVSGLSAGMTLTISGGANSETMLIVSVLESSARRLSSARQLSSDVRRVAPGSVILDSPTQYSYEKGATVKGHDATTTTTKTSSASSTAASSTAASSTAPSSTAPSSTAASSTAESSTAASSTAAPSTAASSTAASSTAASSTAASTAPTTTTLAPSTTTLTDAPPTTTTETTVSDRPTTTTTLAGQYEDLGNATTTVSDTDEE